MKQSSLNDFLCSLWFILTHLSEALSGSSLLITKKRSNHQRVAPTSSQSHCIYPVREFSNSSVGHSSHFEAIVSVFGQGLKSDAASSSAVWGVHWHCEMVVHAARAETGVRSWLHVWVTIGGEQLRDDAVLLQQAWNGQRRSPLETQIARGDLRDVEEARGSWNC